MPSEPRVVQVTNVAPATTKDQIKTLFGFIGRIDDLVIYPSVESTSTTSKVCYVKFEDADDVAVALHLTNTVFIDRALTVVTVPEGRIPDEKMAMSSGYAKNLALSDAPIGDEVERTVYISNLDATVAPETLMQFFGLHAGEVKYARMAGEEGLPVRGAFIEFSEKTAATRALSITGQLLGSRPVTVVPSNSAIVKSASGLEGATSREIEEALRKVNEAQPLISAVVDSDSSRQKRSRSKSRSRHHRSRSQSRRKRSRSRSPRSRRRSTSRSPKRNRSSSKSKESRRRRSRSKSPKSSRSRRSRSRSKSRKNRSNGDKEVKAHGSSKKVQETSRHKSRSSRSKSPGLRDARKDKNQDSVDHDSRKERDRRDKKSGDKQSHSERKSSKYHHQEEQARSSRKAAKQRNEYDEVDEEEERSVGEESENEQGVEAAASESDRSDGEREASGEDSSQTAPANLSRMDMDVESD